jgi:DNA-binding NarL/FixJ family response regulator
MTLEQAIAYGLTTDHPVPVAETPRRVPLSAREHEVAMLIAEGCSNREIGVRLVISERTTEAHVTHVLSKLGLRSRAQVAIWALQNGLIEPPPAVTSRR